MADLSLQTWIIALSAAGLLLTVWMIGIVFWVKHRTRKSQSLKQRMGLTPPVAQTRELNLWIDGQRRSTTVTGGPPTKTVAQRLEAFYRQTGWQTPMSMFLGQIGLLTVVAFVVAMFFVHNIVLALLATIIVPWLAWILARRQIDKRQTLFDQQFVDALELGARSLHAGHPFGGTLRMMSREVPAPVGPIFADICQQQDFGIGLDTALQQAAEQSDQANMRILATAVAMHQKSGGSMADMLERLAHVMRDRVRLDHRIHVLTAQTQFSKRILLLIPVVMFVLLNFVNPHYMRPLYSTATGREIMLTAAAFLAIGGWIMNKMAKIDY